MALTDTKLKSLAKKDKAYQVADSGGLYIEVMPGGSKVWRMRYRLHGKHEKVTIGKYPYITLAEARIKMHEFKGMIAKEQSPMKAKREYKQALLEPETVELFAKHWLKNMVIPNNKNPRGVERVLNKDIIPVIGKKRLQDIGTGDVLKITDKIKARGADTSALLARDVMKRMFSYAISREKITMNPAAMIEAQYIATAKNRDRALTANELERLLKGIYVSSMRRSNKLALHLLILCMVRKSELIEAQWSEIDLDKAEWTIPVERMKKSRVHVVFLPRQAVEMLKELKELASHSDYVFPSPQSNRKPISKATLNTAVRGLGLEISHFVLHDFRRTASTHLHEAGFNSDWIEKCLAHEQKGVRGIYNKAEYASQRKNMLQFWADFIESLMTDNKVILGNFRKAS